jgi:DNA-binding transcriptional LysR family regulator
MSFRRGQLRYFLTVAEEGQITRAASKLHIAQPALSQALAQLETELGVDLFERHARGVTLPSAGEAFLPTARNAVTKEEEAARTARELARAAKGVIEVGFVGPPPTMSMPELFSAFAEAHPDATFSFRDLPFPRGTTASWLGEVDVAFCHCPLIGPDVNVQVLRTEPRAVLANASNPLADRTELELADVLDETFVSYHPDVQPEWAGFHSLDDHRGGPPASMTADHALTTMQMVGILTKTRAITTAPLSDAKLAPAVLPDIGIAPICDARPAIVSLVWRADNHHPLIRAMAAAAERLGGGQATGPMPVEA